MNMEQLPVRGKGDDMFLAFYSHFRELHLNLHNAHSERSPTQHMDMFKTYLESIEEPP